MPQLRFTKDKRGYENTYIVQASRRKGKGRSRILYWFRTPPGVRVGRAALDEEAIRLIEANNPDLQFDWTRILKGQADPDSAPLPERRSQKPDRAHSRIGVDRRGTKPEPIAEQESRNAGPAGSSPAAAAAPPEEPMTAAHSRLGSEGLARLRARYAESMARITDRIADLEQQAQLKTLAERLNPDAWVTDADVSAGLESYEATFEALRGTIGNRRAKPPSTDVPVEPRSDETD